MRAMMAMTALGMVVWLTANTRALPSALGVGHLMRGETPPTARLSAALDRMLRAEGLPRETRLAYDAPVIAAVHPGAIVRNGARWMPLPMITISDAEWASASAETRRLWIDRTFATIRRGRAEYLLLARTDEPIRAIADLFATPLEASPHAALVAEVKDDPSSPSFAFRLFRVLPNPAR